MKDLDGKVAIVTGAAGGIGAGIVRRLSEAGAKVMLTDLDGERLEAATAVAREIEDGAEVASFVADITDEDQIAALLDATASELGALDLLVNNAGVLRQGPTIDIPAAEWRLVIEANLTSAFLCSQAVLPGMIDRGAGAIVNIGSVAAFHYTTPHAHYAASKAGMSALTRDLGYEVAPQGVRVNAIAPSGIISPMNQEGLPESRREALRSAIRIDRWGLPEDVGDAVVFLASERAAFIVGITLPVAGGSDLNILSNLEP
jgi:NAD(P)-dependent dehydrogenase (short-subunit alcohol dehydrogenase family)